MIITRTPFRVSLFGGGSDMPAFYQRATGAVLATTIDVHMYISVHPYFDNRKIHVKYSHNELADSVNEVKHPIVRRVLQRLGIEGGLEITSTADVPAGTGLGSSSSFTVGLLQLLYAYQGKSASPSQLAKEACDVEIEDLGTPIGKQDQYLAAYGGLNFVRFFPDEKVDVAPLVISQQCRTALESSFMMFYTGAQRSAGSVLSEQRKALLTDNEKFDGVQKMVDLAYEARILLEAGEVPAVGKLLHDAWLIKRSLTPGISNPLIDDAYARARAAGAWGGKLLGAGGGGFLLIAAPPTAMPDVCAALSEMKQLRLGLERAGTRIIYMP